MMVKVFGLATATGLIAIAASAAISGCSDDDPVANSADAATDRRAPQPVDSGSTVCFAEDPINATTFPYREPNLMPGACTAADVANVVKFINDNENPTFVALRTELGTAKYTSTCLSCVFGPITAEKWTPILVGQTSEGEEGFLLHGSGCVGLRSGRAGCGQAHSQWGDCIDQACTECSEDQQSDCSQVVQSGACSDATDKLVEACGNNVNSYIESCIGENDFGLDEFITAHCVVQGDGGTDGGDGGSDAGDAGDADAN